MQNYFLEQSKLDSCRIQLPVRKVDVLGKIGDILSPTSTITGEQYTSVDDLIIPLHEDSIKNGIKFRVGKRTILKGNLPSEDVFEIGLSAKMLEAGYFEGINKFNVREVYDYIISTKIISFSWEDFLDAKVYDIDYCYDVSCTQDQASTIVSKLYHSVKYEKKNRITSLYNRFDNTGIELSKRDWQTPTNPNIRIYFKGAEMLNKRVNYPNGKKTSGEFNAVYFGSLSHNVIRLERNLKNKDMWGYEKLEIQRLSDLFDLDLQKLNTIMLTSVKKYYIDTEVRLRGELDLGPTDYLLAVLIDEKIKAGADVQYWSNVVLGYKGGYTQKNRLRNKIKSFVDRPEYKELVEANNATGEVWKKLGLE
jgi:hypothetical protein